MSRSPVASLSYSWPIELFLLLQNNRSRVAIRDGTERDSLNRSAGDKRQVKDEWAMERQGGLRDEKERERGRQGAIFQKRNLICPEVCHGTRINSRALEPPRASKRRRVPQSDAIEVPPLSRHAIIERRRLWCTRFWETPTRASTNEVSYSVSNKIAMFSFEAFQKSRKNCSL